ncbi:MAG: endonuclease/exonuclease/phosphatase family protein [Anaerolineae bacterium]|nr:endonuclease/exonuclease/phosphatase family protein [Anaerolineae bacterium]MDQ7035581.1 endonuclease/exonuclease/phosphatase family protein [Anaerolineae bacterium]
MRILTLNIWGVPYAKHRAVRFRQIAEKSIEVAPDVLCFQEVYLPRTPKIMIDHLKADYPYTHHFTSSVIGSGLLTLSKYPIVDAAFHRFRMSGKLFRKGDYYAGKGIGLVRIQMPDGLVDVYNCHTHAQYEAHNDNEDAIYTNTNLYEAVRFIHTNSGNNPAVLCGDLNTRPDQLGYRILLQLGNLSDSYYHHHNKYPITYSSDNPYTHDFNQCLDYVMLRNSSIRSIELVMNQPISADKAYSDHYGLLAEIDTQQQSSQPSKPDIEAVMQSLLQEVKLALIKTENEQLTHTGHAILGFSTLIDGNLLANFIGRYFKPLAKILRLLVNVGGFGYGIYSLLQAGVNLQSRRATLQAIYDELKHQIDSRCLFDAREWELPS